jgi:hypothetical protein
MPIYLHRVGAGEDCFGKYHAADEIAGFRRLEEHDPTEFDGKPQQS